MAEEAKEATTETQTITIDGTDYVFDDLSDEAKGAVVQLMDINQGLQRLQSQATQLEMARNGFNTVLSGAIGSEGEDMGELDTSPA
jgi:hypothetical protein